MTSSELKNSIKNGLFDKELSYLAYSDIEATKERYLKALGEFESLFGETETAYIISAPGRTELSGNHTDHQGGCVLAASVNLDTVAVVSQRTDRKVSVVSEGYKPFTITLDTLDAQKNEKGKSHAIVRGMANYLSGGKGFCGFDAYTTSNVPKGSGLSSSAAFEVLIGKIFSFLYCNNSIKPSELAEAGHLAEVNYFGKPCGKMDQYACATGGIVYLDFFSDITKSEAVDISFKNLGYSLFITNAGGSHAHLTPEYAAVPEEMRRVAREFGKERLSDIEETLFFRKFSSLRGRVSDRALSRSLHYFTEVNRVKAQLDALKKGDIDTYLPLMQQSGDSSLLNLQNIYPMCDQNERSLALALGISKRLGAVSRVHGGGFAGTIQALVKNEYADSYKADMENIFGNGSSVEVAIRPVGAYVIGEEGAK
jgi:galactokinase